MELREYSLCSRIAVPSLFVERSFQDRGFPIAGLFRNALGVDLSRFHPPRTPPSPPSQGGLKVLYAGSLSVRKGIPDLLEGFHQAVLPEAQLTLIGGSTPELEPLIAAQPDNVNAVGHRPQTELVEHYRRAHCFVMASIEEGMAMVQMQALACGLPLICTTNTGGEDLLRLTGTYEQRHDHNIHEFGAGFVIPIHSPEAIAWCLRALTNVPGMWEEKRSAALKLAQESLSWQEYGRRSINNYQELLARR